MFRRRNSAPPMAEVGGRAQKAATMLCDTTGSDVSSSETISFPVSVNIPLLSPSSALAASNYRYDQEQQHEQQRLEATQGDPRFSASAMTYPVVTHPKREKSNGMKATSKTPFADDERDTPLHVRLSIAVTTPGPRTSHDSAGGHHHGEAMTLDRGSLRYMNCSGKMGSATVFPYCSQSPPETSCSSLQDQLFTLQNTLMEGPKRAGQVHAAGRLVDFSPPPFTVLPPCPPSPPLPLRQTKCEDGTAILETPTMSMTREGADS